MSAEKAIAKLNRMLPGDDSEETHVNADDILLDRLREIGEGEVADAYDRILTNQLKQGPSAIGAAQAELRRAAGTQFDSAVVDAFLRALSPSGRIVSTMTREPTPS